MVGRSPEVSQPSVNPEGKSGAGADLSPARHEAFGMPHVSLEAPSPPRHAAGVSHDTGAAAEKPPHIKVSYQDAGASPPLTKPHATVERDGSVLNRDGQVIIDHHGAVKKPDFLTKLPKGRSDLNISVLLDKGLAAPTEAQKKALAKLTNAWSNDIQSAYGKKPSIETAEAAPLPQPEKTEEVAPPPPPEATPEAAPPEVAARRQFSPATLRAAEHVNRRFAQGESGSISAGDARREFYPHRTAAPHELNEASHLDMLAALANQGADSSGKKAGLYGFGQQTLAHSLGRFLSPEILQRLGNPPDWNKINDDPTLLKEVQDDLKANGAPEGLQANLADPETARKFADFTKNLTTGTGEVSPDAMKRYLPESLQSALALQTVRDYKKAGLTPTDTALAWQLDRPPGEALTQADRDTPEGKQITTAANRFYQLAYSQQGAQDGAQINWTGANDNPNDVAFRVANDALQFRNGDPTGCVKAHNALMAHEFGFTSSGDAFTAFQNTWDKLRTGRYGKFNLVHIDNQTPETSLHTGDIFGVPWAPSVVRQWGGRNCGHIGVVGTDGTQIAQKTYSLDNLFGGRYDTGHLYAIRAAGPSTEDASD